MAQHAPASRLNAMKGTGLAAVRAGGKPPADKAEAEKAFQKEGEADVEAALAAMRAADKFAEVMDNAPYASEQTPIQIWGVKAAAEKQYRFSRWYFMAPNSAIVDLFMRQDLYDAADVEERRALALKYGTRYAALGPQHSRHPFPGSKPEDKARREKFPSLTEQLAKKGG